MDDVFLPHTLRLLKFHRYFAAVIAGIVVIGATISAIQIGNEPVLGPLVAMLVMGLFYAVLLWQNKKVTQGLKEKQSGAWLNALFWAMVMSLFVIGIPAVRELWSKETRSMFFAGIPDNNK
jgi:hypothetical protein